jgi:hypothetical protein
LIIKYAFLPGLRHLPPSVQTSSFEQKHCDGEWHFFTPFFSCLQILLSGIVEQSELVPQVTSQDNKKHLVNCEGRHFPAVYGEWKNKNKKKRVKITAAFPQGKCWPIIKLFKCRVILPFLQALSPAQYSPSAQAPLHVLLLGLWQVFSPVWEDSLQTVFIFWLEQSEEEMHDSKQTNKIKL